MGDSESTGPVPEIPATGALSAVKRAEPVGEMS